MKKRIFSLLLLAAMAASLLTAPAMAARDPNRFTDLYDSNAVTSVESLRLMGVMDGYSNGTFRPDGQLTRAQFCKMVVCAMHAEGKNAISGFSDGKFYPDRTVTLGQAATILLRVLGYKDENVGGVWPDSYLSFAASIGLTDGIDTAKGNDPLKRSDAAVLFNNLLRADVQGESGSSSFLAAAGLTTKTGMVLVATNTIRVCDTRLTGYYESCTPSPTEPTSIHLLGNDFDVLTTAQATLARFRPGEQITLLFTEDNKVAGAVKPGTAGANANAIGIAASISGTSATIDLLCGVRIQGTVDLGVTASESQIAYAARLEDLAQMQHRLVRVTSVGKNLIGLVRLGGGASGSLDLEKRRIGSNSLAETVSVFRYTASGLEVLSLDDLGAGPIPNGEISYAHLNWANRVDIIVLGGVNDGSVLYGRTSLTMDDNTEREIYRMSIYNSAGRVAGPLRTNYDIPGGVYVAAVVSNDGTSFSSLQRLTELKEVPNTAWSGQSAVTVDGRSYTISESVMAFNKDIYTWIEASEGRSIVDIAHAYARQCNLYASGDGVIRIIEVGGDHR